MDYREPLPTTRDEFQQLLTYGDAPAVSQALVGLVANEPDWRWLQALCLRLLGHPDGEVRAVAVTSIGHIARIHGQIERASVEPELLRLLADPDLVGRTQDALDDIEVFVKEKK